MNRSCFLSYHVKMQLLTARHFITRALLGAENFAQAQTILRDNGVGAGSGCSINMTFLRYLQVDVLVVVYPMCSIGKRETDFFIMLKWHQPKKG